MSHQPLDDVTRQHIAALIQANLSGRDDLYAAADALDNKSLALICRHLADDLASNAIELQQIALAAGTDDVDAVELGTELQAELLALLQKAEGDTAVLEEAEECEQVVAEEYDEAIRQSENSSIADVLAHQRERVEFGKSVVHEVRAPKEGDSL